MLKRFLDWLATDDDEKTPPPPPVPVQTELPQPGASQPARKKGGRPKGSKDTHPRKKREDAAPAPVAPDPERIEHIVAAVVPQSAITGA